MSDIDFRDVYRSLQKERKPALGAIFITDEGLFVNLGDNAEHSLVFGDSEYDSDDYYALEDNFNMIKANGGSEYEPFPYIDLWKMPNRRQWDAIIDWVELLISSGRKTLMVNSGGFNETFDLRNGATPKEIKAEIVRRFSYDEEFSPDAHGAWEKAYHGSPSDFDRFDRPTNWFSSSRKYSEGFANFASNSAYMYTCMIDTSNVLDCGNTGVPCYGLIPTKPYRLGEELRDIIDKLGVSETEIREKLDEVAEEYDEPAGGYRMRLHVFTRSKAFRDLVKSKGYSGIHAIERGVIDTWGMFDSDDISIVKKEKIK